MISRNVAQGAMESSMDALWMKLQVHLDNIANYETPGYKAKTVNFSEVLDSATKKDDDTSHLRLNVVEDATTSTRLDGNNVDMEKEQLEMWKTQAQY
ncbi:MAG: flagellar basal body rod protein FlgB, partial [Oscillospiraceae bacterium]